jgi:hypothetical protein
MNIVEVRKIVGEIKAQLFKKSNSYSIGMLKSNFRGTGLQFKEHRQYTHGDDVRFIDWKILAKTGHPFIKTFEEERNVQIAVVIDTGPSMLYGWNGVSKLQAALEITCMLYLLARETNDFIHAVLLGDEIVDVPAGNGEKGIVQLISSLSRKGLIDEHGKLTLGTKNQEFGQPEIKSKEAAIKKHIARNREVIILSDWLEWFDMKGYKQIIANKRSHCFRLVAPLDTAKSTPVSMKVGNRVSSGVQNFKIKEGKVEESEIKRIKTLELKERYLDQFVREMI